MIQAVKAISDSIARNTAGVPDGPVIDWMAKDCARNAAQVLLTIAAGFKNKRYKDDKEWRLVYCPNLALNNSAPDTYDMYFKSAIRELPRRHIELRIESEMMLFYALRPQIPFIDIRQSPFHNSVEERARIEEVLLENSRSDIKCKWRGGLLIRGWHRISESVDTLRKRWPISPLI
jgi:hypothetical protein